MTLSLFAASAVIKTSAAAPSLSVLALAAVTVPERKSTIHIKTQRLSLFMETELYNLLSRMNETNSRCVITVLLLEHCLQFGNFAEVDPPPLFIRRHDHIRFAFKTTPTSEMLCYVMLTDLCWPWSPALEHPAVPLCGMLTGTISLARTPDSYAALLRLYEPMAKASCSSLVMLQFLAVFSAQLPWQQRRDQMPKWWNGTFTSSDDKGQTYRDSSALN